jgi:monovalent cation/hydrogen antiporter
MPEHLELVIFGLLVAVVGFVLLSRVLKVPYPVFLVVGGLTLSFVPGLPSVELPPDLVLLIFLPPLLYSSAFFSSPRDLRANLRPIALLSVGLVLLTSVTVAVVGHTIIGLSWPVAFVLGVVVSPTDPVAVAATAERFGMPRRVVAILEGESLINDGTALVLYRTAVAAVVIGSFSVFQAGLELVLSSIGGAAIGLAVGWVISRVRRWVEDLLVETTIALFTGYAAYIPAEEFGASGVLAVVAAALSACSSGTSSSTSSCTSQTISKPGTYWRRWQPYCGIDKLTNSLSLSRSKNPQCSSRRNPSVRLWRQAPPL